MENFSGDERALLKLIGDGGIHPLPDAWRCQEHGGADSFQVARQASQALREIDWRAHAHGNQFENDALGDVCGREKDDSGILRTDGERDWSHVEVGDDGGMGDHAHLRFTCGPRGHVENRSIVWRNCVGEPGGSDGIFFEKVASFVLQALQCDGSFGLTIRMMVSGSLKSCEAAAAESA